MSSLPALGQEPWGKELRKPPLQQQRVLQPAPAWRPPPQQWQLSQWQHACSNQPQSHPASQELPAANLQSLHLMQHGAGQQQPATPSQPQWREKQRWLWDELGVGRSWKQVPQIQLSLTAASPLICRGKDQHSSVRGETQSTQLYGIP